MEGVHERGLERPERTVEAFTRLFSFLLHVLKVTIDLKLLPGVDRVELPLEELENKRQEVTVELYQRWQGRSRELVAGDPIGQAVTKATQPVNTRVKNMQDTSFSDKHLEVFVDRDALRERRTPPTVM